VVQAPGRHKLLTLENSPVLAPPGSRLDYFPEFQIIKTFL
jgi:hypothetical protein